MEAPEIPTLETERLRLRGIRGSDFEDYAALYADPEVTRLISSGETWDRGRSWRHMAFPSIRVAERIGERLEGRIDHFGRQMLLYGLDRTTYLAEVAPAGVTARCAG